MQRRYQKLIEESPSPVVDDALRTRIGEAATAIAREAGYVNAGTVEFLVESGGSFYFMEVNARLQVEHPVTEMVTGFDLVRYQILVALGEPVQLEPSSRGHAIECRLNAEDPLHDFLPGPGVVTRLRRPGGSFVRLDTGIAEGRPVVGNYDSLFGKLIVWAEDRELCRRRMLRALDEIEVEGIPTTIPFHRWALATEEFRTAGAHTKFVEEALAAGRFQAEDAATAPASGPALAPVTGDGDRPIRLAVEVDGRRIPVLLWGEHLPVPPKAPASASALGGGDPSNVTAPMQGTILQVMVQPGQQVASGDVVLILEAMKMENHIAAARNGVVKDVLVGKGDVVDSGTLLVSLE